MLKIYKGQEDRFSSELWENPLDRLSSLATKAEGRDLVVERELEVAMELIEEVFNVSGDEVRKMIKERMASSGIITVKDEWPGE